VWGRRDRREGERKWHFRPDWGLSVRRRARGRESGSCCDPRGGRKLQKQIGLRGRSWSVTHEGFGRIRGHVDGFGAGRERDGARRDGYRGRRERFEIGDECRATRYGRCG